MRRHWTGAWVNQMAERSDEIEGFWLDFCSSSQEASADTSYQVWHFSNSRESALELANLVLTGIKRATASLVEVNKLMPEVTPYAGGYSVVTDLDGHPKCVIRTDQVRLVPFRDVDEEFAFEEGEGDRTLEFWRRVHHSYFRREAAEFGMPFDDQSLICCERFSLLYPR